MLLIQYYSITLQISGNVPVLIKFLKILDRGIKTYLVRNMIIRADISLYQCALLMLEHQQFSI